MSSSLQQRWAAMKPKPYLDKVQLTRVLQARAKELEAGYTPFIDPSLYHESMRGVTCAGLKEVNKIALLEYYFHHLDNRIIQVQNANGETVESYVGDYQVHPDRLPVDWADIPKYIETATAVACVRAANHHEDVDMC